MNGTIVRETFPQPENSAAQKTPTNARVATLPFPGRIQSVPRAQNVSTRGESPCCEIARGWGSLFPIRGASSRGVNAGATGLKQRALGPAISFSPALERRSQREVPRPVAFVRAGRSRRPEPGGA